MATRRLIAAASLAVVAIAGSAMSASATGSCAGDGAAYSLSAGPGDAVLNAYDRNGDGVICVLPEGPPDAFPGVHRRLPSPSVAS